MSIFTIIDHRRGGITALAKETGPGDLGQSFHAWTIIMLVFLDLSLLLSEKFLQPDINPLKIPFWSFPLECSQSTWERQQRK